MQPRSSFDRTLLIPVVISIVSILGICLIFLPKSPGKTVVHPTAIPPSVIPLEAETQTPFPSPASTSTQEESPPSATTTGPVIFFSAPTEISPSPSPFITASLPPPSATPIPDRIKPLQAGRYYDDVDPNIAYDPHWIVLKNPSTATSYKGTIHASYDTGSQASFRFTGKQFRLGYKRGKDFGTVTVLIDDQPYTFDEQALDLVWSSPKLSPGDHFVRIIHDSGESVNLDYILIVN